MACELYCCLLPQCEALRTCRSGFLIATAGRFEEKYMSSVHGPLMGWTLRTMGGPGLKNLGPCHL